MYRFKHFFCGLAVSALLVTSAQAGFKDFIKNPIVISALVSAGLSAVYPHVGGDNHDRALVSGGVLGAGFGYAAWALWQLHRTGHTEIMAIVNTPFLKRSSFDQEKLDMFLRDHKLKNEGEVPAYIRRRIRHALASGLFFGSQFGVNRYWIHRSDRDRHVENVRREYMKGLDAHNKRVAGLEKDLAKFGDMYEVQRKELADMTMDPATLTDKQLNKKIKQVKDLFKDLKGTDHISEQLAEEHYDAWRKAVEKGLSDDKLSPELHNALIIKERHALFLRELVAVRDYRAAHHDTLVAAFGS